MLKIENSSNNKFALGFLEKGYFCSNNPEIAIKHFDKSIELNPNLAEAYFNKGQCLKKLNKDFKQSFDKARQLDPNIDTSFKDSK